MKKILIFIFSLFLTTGCFVSDKKETVVKVKEKKKKVDKIASIMNDLSLEEKIAQMLIIEYDLDEVDDKLLAIMDKSAPGGFILMKPNITTFDKTRKFVADLKEKSKVPLIISIDQEGGSVQRLKYLSDVKVTDIPFMYNLGQTHDTLLAYQTGKVIAEEVRTIGVNVVYAPVVDIYSNENNTVIGKRSFGNDASVVSSMAISLARGLEDYGVIATYKHFPGHGDTEIDSHISLPIINKNIDELNSLELIPFKAAVNNGAKIIMVGHIALPNITFDNIPASLSKEIINMLRSDLGYNGLIVTDALNMGALTNEYTNEEICVKAIESGADLLLIPSDGISSIDYIKENVDEERIDESVRKILKFKYENLTGDNLLDKTYLGNEDHLQIVSKFD